MNERGQCEILAIIFMGIISVGLWGTLIYKFIHSEPKEVIEAQQNCIKKCKPNYGFIYENSCYCKNDFRKN